MKLYILDSKTLIMILRKLEPRLSGAKALQHFLMVRIGQYNRLVGRNDGEPYWPDPGTWADNAWEFIIDDEKADNLAKQWGVVPLKDCFVTDESLIKSLGDRFLELTDLVLSRYGTLPEVRDKVISLLDEWEVDPRESERIRAVESLQELSSYLVSRAENKGQFSEETPVERKKPAKKSKSTSPAGVALPDVDVNILPDVVLQLQRIQSQFSYHEDRGSPLAQILREWETQRFFLLFGMGDSAVSGAGKTTTLQYLTRENGFDEAVFVPLCDVYNSFGLRRFQKEDGWPRIFSWLEHHGCPIGREKSCLLLLDGLEEIVGHEGIRAFCDDLTELVRDSQVRLVLSCVLPPEQLPGWYDLKNISTIFGKFLHCKILPMTPEQRKTCLGDREPAGFPQVITTPYLLSLCKNVNLAAEEQKPLFFRWVSGKRPPKHGSSLFFRSLVAQLCNWFQADPGNDAQNERDSFALMFALPAVAFHMVLNEVYDANYAPEVCPVDSETVERLLSLAFPVYKRSLHRCIPYRKSDRALAALADSMRELGAEGLLSEKTGTILNRSLDRETMEYTYRFANRALRDGLAALHLANLFYAAHEDLLPTGVEFDEFYTCPVRFLPHALLESAAALLEERMQEYGEVEWILKGGPSQGRGGQNDFCRYLSCSLASAFCTALRFKTEQQWRAAAEQAYEALLSKEPRLAKQCAMDHAVNFCTQSKLLREEGAYPAAAEQARAAIRFTQSHQLLNADGYQALAMLYLKQVESGLNLQGIWKTCDMVIPEEDITRSRQVLEELQRLAQLQEPGPLESEVFGTLSAESVSLIPDCLCLLEKAKLRLDGYKQEEFFGSGEVEFLLAASFVAKGHSVWAALSPAVSGAALNLLAGFFENDQERMENDPELPFFAANPQFHLPMDPERLAYPEKDCCAARLYLRIIHLRRGLQPYSCRNLAQALLSRRFRLDERGQPVPACDGENEFTLMELKFLNEITRRACSRLGPTYAIPRIRYLNYQIDLFDKQKGWEQMISWDLEEAGALFRREWEKGKCGEKLDSRTETKADLLAVMLAGLYRESYLPGVDPVSWMAKIKDYHFRCRNACKVYTIGGSFR